MAISLAEERTDPSPSSRIRGQTSSGMRTFVQPRSSRCRSRSFPATKSSSLTCTSLLLACQWFSVDVYYSIQFAGAVGLAQCPDGCTLQVWFLYGRTDAAQAAPDGLIMEPFGTYCHSCSLADTFDTIFLWFLDVGVQDSEAVWLLFTRTVPAWATRSRIRPSTRAPGHTVLR